MKRPLAASLVAITLLGALPALAQIPGNAHVDPQAPCFRWPATDLDGDGVFDRLDHCPNTAHGCTVDRYGCESDADQDGVCDGLDQCANTPPGTEVNPTGCPKSAAATTPPAARPVPLPASVPPPMKPMERQLVETGTIRLENVYFETGSANLLPESESALREAIETLEGYPNLRIEVQGHTDTRGAESFNLRLSQSRAESVRSFMLEHSKLAATHLKAKGYGESEPETEERNDEELLRNRRVVLKVLNPEALPRGVKVESKD